MSSSFDTVQVALSWLLEQVDPANEQAKAVIHEVKRTVDRLHDHSHATNDEPN